MNATSMTYDEVAEILKKAHKKSPIEKFYGLRFFYKEGNVMMQDYHCSEPLKEPIVIEGIAFWFDPLIDAGTYASYEVHFYKEGAFRFHYRYPSLSFLERQNDEKGVYYHIKRPLQWQCKFESFIHPYDETKATIYSLLYENHGCKLYREDSECDILQAINKGLIQDCDILKDREELITLGGRIDDQEKFITTYCGRALVYKIRTIFDGYTLWELESRKYCTMRNLIEDTCYFDSGCSWYTLPYRQALVDFILRQYPDLIKKRGFKGQCAKFLSSYRGSEKASLNIINFLSFLLTKKINLLEL